MERSIGANKTNAGRATVPLVQEEILLDKKVVETGKVRISKRVREEDELVDIPLLSEEVIVERVSINKYVKTRPVVRDEKGLTVIPIVEETLVIEKRLLLVEELRIRKKTLKTRERKIVTLRKEEVDVRRIAATEEAGS